MKKILIIIAWVASVGAFAQQVVSTNPAATATYPQAGVSTEQDFSKDLALPKVEAPIPSTQPGTAYTPQQMYSPNTNGGTYNAAALQALSEGHFVSVGSGNGGMGGGASFGSSTVANGESYPSVGITALPSPKKRFSWFDKKEDVEIEDEIAEAERDKQKMPEFPGFDQPPMGPVGDGVWVLLLLALGYIGLVLKKRKARA